MNSEHVNDYRMRLAIRRDQLREMADQADLDGRPNEGHRLSGKAQGLDLAIDYLRGYPESDEGFLAGQVAMLRQVITELDNGQEGTAWWFARGFRALLSNLEA